MRYGVTLPNMGIDVHTLAQLATEAETAGWDGVFVWDCLFLPAVALYARKREEANLQ